MFLTAGNLLFPTDNQFLQNNWQLSRKRKYKANDENFSEKSDRSFPTNKYGQKLSIVKP